MENQAKAAAEKMAKKVPTSGGPAAALIKGLVLTAGLGYGLYNSVFTVAPGSRAVMYNRFTGIQEGTKEEGMHIMLPWIERPTVFDVRTKAHQVSSLTGSRDLQMVNVSLRVLTRPNTSALPDIYRRLGLNYLEVVLPSIVNETAKQVMAQFNASQLITQREHVSRMIARNLTERATEFNINVEDVSVTHLSFGREYTAAVEAKQVAQQEAERARFVVDKAIQEKKSTIIRAQGQAKAAELVGEAIKKNPAFTQLRRLDAAKEIAQVMSKSQNRVYLNSESLLLNLLHDSTTGSFSK
ncbi:prohibitin-2 [Thraustotheca clavata]|uniref:Prohibitin n=1 Tax=Thraustotheca clavata TaxID=74557 RepID=A0A1W0A7U1_9STRA|nr:prohibitin-2 [Thraustotheca clavata]